MTRCLVQLRFRPILGESGSSAKRCAKQPKSKRAKFHGSQKATREGSATAGLEGRAPSRPCLVKNANSDDTAVVPPVLVFGKESAVACLTTLVSGLVRLRDATIRAQVGELAAHLASLGGLRGQGRVVTARAFPVLASLCGERGAI